MELFDSTGASISIQLSARDDHEGTLHSVTRLSRLDETAVTHVDPALEPGSYRLRLTLGGYRELLLTVDVPAGRVTEVTGLVMERL